MSLHVLPTLPSFIDVPHEQPFTMAEILAERHVTLLEITDSSLWDSWSVDRIKAILACGVPSNGRLWLRPHPQPPFSPDDAQIRISWKVTSFEWCLEWSVDDGPLLRASGSAPTEEAAFENLLAALR